MLVTNANSSYWFKKIEKYQPRTRVEAMAGKPDIVAGGAVVLRNRDNRQQVLVVHRPGYDDWSLPKGKVKPDEFAQVAAVREVFEETGVWIKLRMRLPDTSYRIGHKKKTVKWWVAEELSHETWQPSGEVDKRIWLDWRTAIKTLTYPDEQLVLEQALDYLDVMPFLIVRHAKAMDRKNWRTDKDHDRRLTERGRRQAKALTGLLSCFGTEHLASSSSTRCVDTLKPAAKKLHTQIKIFSTLSEESATSSPADVKPLMRGLLSQALKSRQVWAVCGHRPVFPLMFDAIEVEPFTLKPAELVAIYCRPSGEFAHFETIRSRL